MFCARREDVERVEGRIIQRMTREMTIGDRGVVALAHYPSIKHFEDMLASEDYQAVNQKFRVPALKDTCILCTCELGLDVGEGRAKL